MSSLGRSRKQAHHLRWINAGLLVLVWSWCAGFGCVCGSEGPTCFDADEIDFECLFGVRCADGECHRCCFDEHCPFGQRCIENTCIDTCDWYRCDCCVGERGCDCCDDSDCPSGLVCLQGANDIDPEVGINSACVEPCLMEGEICVRQDMDCCPGRTCAPDVTVCEWACDSDEECWQRDFPAALDLLCLERVCRYLGCEANEDCPSSQACIEGGCMTLTACEEIAYCRLGPGDPRVPMGGELQLLAGSYLEDGELAVAVLHFTAEQNLVLETTQEGLVTGLSPGGPVTIFAEVIGCQVSCEIQVNVIDY